MDEKADVGGERTFTSCADLIGGLSSGPPQEDQPDGVGVNSGFSGHWRKPGTTCLELHLLGLMSAMICKAADGRCLLNLDQQCVRGSRIFSAAPKLEHNLAEVGVEGSNPFARSRFSQ